MKKMLRSLSYALPMLAALLLWILVAPISPAMAQTVDGQFQTQINPGAGTGGQDQLQVSVELAASPTFDLGSATLMFTFNDAALALPSSPGVNEQLASGTDYQFEDPFIGDLGNGKFYSPSTVTVFGQPNRLSVNIVLEVTGAGQPLPEAMTPVVTLFFDITDAAQPADLSWIVPSSGDPNPTVVFLEDNLTEVAPGIFADDATELPVELVAFEAVADGDGVRLHWETASETNNAGFEIQHSKFAEANLENKWDVLAFVEGAGTTTEARQYTYRVDGLSPDVHRFRLKQVDFDGTFEYSPEVEVTVALQDTYLLSAAYPNPFNPQTRFTAAVQRPQQVTVALYDVLGRQVQTLFNGTMDTDRPYRFVVEGAGLASGIYLIRATGEHFAATRQIILLR